MIHSYLLLSSILGILSLRYASASASAKEARTRTKREAPVPPKMTNSNWPIAHGSTWNSDVSYLPGPSKSAQSTQLLINGDTIKDINSILLSADSITLTQSSHEGYMWGSGVSGVYQLQVTPGETGEVKIINTIFRDVNFEYHGAYSLLAEDGTYFAAAKTSIQAYQNEVPFDFTTPIILAREYFVPGLEEGEHIVGLTMSYDEVGYLIFATTMGKVGGVSQDFLTPSANIYQIPGLETVALPDHFVSNSIGMDGPEGGIYVCTSKSMNRLIFNSETQEISLAWQTDYGSGSDEWYWGRLGPGCGTSPTIVGPSGEAEYVVITDGENPMNIRFYDVKTGNLAGKQVVGFGGATNGDSTTDQSIAVYGYKAVVVNNWVAPAVTSFCSDWFASSDASDALKHECPYLFGSYVNGIEQFELNPATGEVTSTWANANVSCTSSVPLVSAATNTFYCLGKREQPGFKRATYTIEAVDWNTGRSLYHVDLSPSLLANSLYAGTIVGVYEDVVMGTLSGIVRWSDSSCAHPPCASSSSREAENKLKYAAMEEQESVWKIMDQLGEWNLAGHVPTKEELKALGITI